MPTFDFSLPKKKTKERKTANRAKVYKVIEKDATGVIWINESGEYYVKIDNNHSIDIHPNCYSCKGKNRIYLRGLHDNHRLCIMRSVDDACNLNRNHYLPFAPGCLVSGDIVINGYVRQFVIKNCWTEVYNDIAHDALAFYKENYNKICAIAKNID